MTKHTPGPVTGPYHGPSISDQLRIIGSLCGTDNPTGKAEQRAAIAYVSVVTAEMLEALAEANRMIGAYALLLERGGNASDAARVTAIEKQADAALAKARGEG